MDAETVYLLAQLGIGKLGNSATSGVGSQTGLTSTSFASLTTPAALTVVTNSKALVVVSGQIANSTVGDGIWLGISVSGATTIAASQTWSLLSQAAVSGGYVILGSIVVPFGTGGASPGALTPGSNTFTAEGMVNASSGNFSNVTVTVVPIN